MPRINKDCFVRQVPFIIFNDTASSHSWLKLKCKGALCYCYCHGNEPRVTNEGLTGDSTNAE